MTSTPLTSTPLSVRLRAATRTQHERAESTPFITALMSGALGVAAYADLATQHHAVYTALEAGGRAVAGTPAGATVVLSTLVRVPSLEADLTHLLGPTWRDQARALPATQRYVDRLTAVAHALPGYVAHAYTRYLGDLSGGQAVRTMLQRHYGVPDDGVQFYTFDAIPKAKVFKDDYRARLDALPLTVEECDTVLAEAQLAFDLNTALFTELGEAHLP